MPNASKASKKRKSKGQNSSDCSQRIKYSDIRENNNFGRLCRLLIDGSTLVLRNILDQLHSPHLLQQHLQDPQIHAVLDDLKSKKIFSDEDWKKLFPTNGFRFNSSKFDIALLWLLVPITRSGRRSLRTDVAITRINIHQRQLYERFIKSETIVSDAEFSRCWDDIACMLLGLGGIQGREAEINGMKLTPIDSRIENHYSQLLVKWSKNDEHLRNLEAKDFLEAQQKQMDETESSSNKTKMEMPEKVASIGQALEDTQSKFEALRLAGAEEVGINQRRTACKNIDKAVKNLQSKLEILRLSNDDEIIAELEGKVKHLNDENELLKAELLKIVENSEKTQGILRKLTIDHESLIKDMKEMKAFKKQQEINNQILNFSQICWNIEGLMFKYVFPSLYNDSKSYRLQDIEEEIKKLKTENQKQEAKTKLTDLKKKLNWVSPDYEKCMARARKCRSYLAHPSLPMCEVEECINFLHQNNKLQEWMTLEQAGELQNILLKLRSMDATP